MTNQKDQAEHPMENASDIAEKFAALGSMDAVKESGVFDELMGFIVRGEIQLDGKDGNIAADHPRRTGTRAEIRAQQPPGLRQGGRAFPVRPGLSQRLLLENRIHGGRR